MKFPGHLLAFACTFLLGEIDAWSAGVAALKDQPFHRDLTAKTVAYSRIIDSHGPYLRIVSGRANIDILRSNLAGHIELPDGIPENILYEPDIAPLRESLNAIRSFTIRYPRSSALLDQRAAAIAAHIERFDVGYVRYEGTWITPKNLTKILENRRRENEASELTEVEKRVFEASRRDDGLVLHDGRWMTPGEVEKLQPGSPTELSSCIEPLANGDLGGARFAVRNLTLLTSRQTGAPKVRTERLATVIRNLFLSEDRLTQQMLARTNEDREAATQDRNAEQWMKPNGFGTIREDLSRECRLKAIGIRQRSAETIASRKEDLRDRIKEIETVATDFQKLREQRVVVILTAAAQAVTARHLSDASR